MIVIFEHDHREYGDRRWWWIPGGFRGNWHGRSAWRIWWGFWSLSFYPEPGLSEFFDYVRSQQTEWKDR
jgi:hypothetical protein